MRHFAIALQIFTRHIYHWCSMTPSLAKTCFPNNILGIWIQDLLDFVIAVAQLPQWFEELLLGGIWSSEGAWHSWPSSRPSLGRTGCGPMVVEVSCVFLRMDRLGQWLITWLRSYARENDIHYGSSRRCFLNDNRANSIADGISNVIHNVM